MTVTFFTKLPCIICLKKLCFCFSYAKSLWNWATDFSTFFLPWGENLFSPHQNVSLWISKAEAFQLWALASPFGCDTKWTALLYMNNKYIVSASKAIDFSFYISSLRTMSPRPHCACRATPGSLHQLLCFHTPSGAPIDPDGSSVWDSSTGCTAGEIRGRLIRVHMSDKSSAA